MCNNPRLFRQARGGKAPATLRKRLSTSKPTSTCALRWRRRGLDCSGIRRKPAWLTANKLFQHCITPPPRLLSEYARRQCLARFGQRCAPATRKQMEFREGR
eukprot:3419984-Alexandrium_andersonii.AAC.1